MYILVVDYDEAEAATLAAVLTRANHQVQVATLGSQALVAGLTHTIDLVICDLNLPDLPGIEVIRALRMQAPHLPIVVISSLERHIWEPAAHKAGAALFLNRPVVLDDLQRAVESIAAARLTLRLWLIDSDRMHRMRLVRTMSQLGCQVTEFNTGEEVLQKGEMSPNDIQPTLWMIDANDAHLLDVIRQGRAQGAAVFVFGHDNSAEAEEKLMRAGVALFFAKPVDIDSLLIQASFICRH